MTIPQVPSATTLLHLLQPSGRRASSCQWWKLTDMVSVSQLSGDQCSSFHCSKGFLPSPLVALLSRVGCVDNVWQWGSKCWKSCNVPGSFTVPCARCICPGKTWRSSLWTDNAKGGGFHWHHVCKLSSLTGAGSSSTWLEEIQKGGFRRHLRNGHKTLITLSCLKLQGMCL